MGFVRHEKRSSDRPIFGGFVTYTTPYGVLTFVYRIPQPGEFRTVDPIAVALANKITRMQVELLRYLEDKEKGSNDPPVPSFEERELQPLVDAIARTIIEIRGLKDELTGHPIPLDELAKEELDEILFALSTKTNERVGKLVSFYKAVTSAGGLRGDQRARLAQWLQIQYIDGGCNCLQCSEIDEADPNCRFADLRPLDDVFWLIEQYNVHQGSDTGTMPRWLLETFGEIKLAQARRQQLQKEAEERKQLIDKHLGGKK